MLHGNDVDYSMSCFVRAVQEDSINFANEGIIRYG